MKRYYCEKMDEPRPYFPGWTIESISDSEAIEEFRRLHGPLLQVVYDEHFNVIYEMEVS